MCVILFFVVGCDVCVKSCLMLNMMMLCCLSLLVLMFVGGCICLRRIILFGCEPLFVVGSDICGRLCCLKRVYNCLV